jgi:aryl-alcohol dehydrogenase-like predicted oxidoreductase
VYRGMLSEQCVGRALAASGVPREAVLIATKGGYVPSQLVREGKIPRDELKGSHTLAPRSVEAMLERSLENMGLETVDVYYLHNPETQVADKDFYAKMRAAFEVLEAGKKKGQLRAYGTATWNGYRMKGQLQLEKVVEAARAAGGEQHGFKWVQLPINPSMREAVKDKTQIVFGEALSFIEAAKRFGVHVVTSGTIGQGEFAGPNLAQAINFARSQPGVVTALVGMSKAAHVRENLEIAARSSRTT